MAYLIPSRVPLAVDPVPVVSTIEILGALAIGGYILYEFFRKHTPTARELRQELEKKGRP